MIAHRSQLHHWQPTVNSTDLAAQRLEKIRALRRGLQMYGHIGLILLAEWNVNVRLQTLAKYVLLHATHDPDDLGITSPFDPTTRQEPDVLPNRMAARP